MREHIIIVAWLHIVLSSLVLLGGVLLFLLCFVFGVFNLAALPFLGGLGVFALVLFGVFSVPGLIMGWGLLQFAPWARILAILLGILGLVFHPVIGLGTLLSIYTLIILFHPKTVALFEGRGIRSY